MLDVAIGHAGFAVMCMVDSGSVNTLFPMWVASEAEVDLAGSRQQGLSLGGHTYEVSLVSVHLEAAGLGWDAEVGFCDGWDSNWGLLGQESFFRWFTVTFRASDRTFEIVPIAE